MNKEEGDEEHIPGRFELFRNHDEHGNPFAKPKTILVDGAQLESGDSLNKAFLDVAKDEIAQFRRDRAERMGDINMANKISDQDLLRGNEYRRQIWQARRICPLRSFRINADRRLGC